MQGPGLVFHESDFSTRIPAASSLPLALLAMLVVAVVIALLVRRMRAHGAWAEEARAVMTRAKARELRAGVHVLAGRVHTSDGQPAIRVRIHEGGREWRTKNGMRHRWTEVSRDVEARPFDLITSAGTVRVEPDASVKLVDLMATVRRPANDVREREASLDPGEEVFVSGLVRRVRGGEGAYRGGDGPSWVMRAAPGGTLVCSTEPLSEPHDRWAAFYRRAVLAAGAVGVFVVGFLSVAYFPLVLSGVVVEARVVELQHRVVRGRRSTAHHYEVTADVALPDGRTATLVDDVRPGAWARLHLGDVLPFVVVPAAPALHQIGRRPGLPEPAPVAGAALLVLGGVLFAATWRRRRAWWEQDKVVTHGRGPLEDH